MLVSHRHKYSVIYTITSIIVYGSSTSYDMSTDYNSHESTKYKYKYKYTRRSGVPKSRWGHSPKYKHDENARNSGSYAHDLSNKETPKREVNEGLAPWWPPALGWCATTWGVQGGSRPKDEEGVEKGRVMVAVVVLLKVMELDFEGEGRWWRWWWWWCWRMK